MANEDFTTWTEYGDVGGWITVTASSVAWNDLPRDRSAGVYKSHNETGDFTHTFKYITPADAESTPSSWVYLYRLTSALVDPDNSSHDSINIFEADVAGTPLIYIQLRENGTEYTSAPGADFSVGLSWSTTYYITVTRDDDAGANSTGQITVDISTGNYGGQGGDSPVDTLSVDCSVGEQNDYIYAIVTSPRGTGGTYPQDGEVQDLDFGGSATYVDATATIAASSNISATGVKRTVVSGLSDTNVTDILIGFGNDELWVEDR